MPVCLRSQPSCHASLKFAGYSNLLNGDILKMSNLKLSQPGVVHTQLNLMLLTCSNIQSAPLHDLNKIFPSTECPTNRSISFNHSKCSFLGAVQMKKED